MTPCPHAGLQVEGRCYWCCKVAATNGHRSKLSVEQLGFIGFVTDTGQQDNQGALVGDWLGVVSPSTIDTRLEELERRLDLAPNWFALARRILEPEKDKS